MIYLELFWVFFKISIFTVGGGAAMIPLIQQEILANGWMTEDMLMNVIGIAESTPGPIAVNMATYVGSSMGGFLGSLCATVGMVLPPFMIILLVARFFSNFLNNRFVGGALNGVKPVIIGLIISVGIYFALKVILPNYTPAAAGAADWRAFGLFAGLVLCEIGCLIWKKNIISPILLIIVSAAMGMLIYAF